MLRFTTTVTQKGQMTLPKPLRDHYGIVPFTTLLISTDDLGIRIEPAQDITQLAGSFAPKQMKPIMEAREEMEKTYHRS